MAKRSLISLNRSSTLIALTGCLLIVAAAAWWARDAIKTQQALQAARIADAVAARVHDRIGYYRTSAARIIDERQLAGLFGETDAARRAQIASRLTAMFPYAAKVRLIAPGERTIDPDSIPRLGYACFDLIDQGRFAAEYHLLKNAPAAHIDIPVAIHDAGGATVGHLLITLSPEAIDDELLTGPGVAAMELRQYLGADDFIVLARSGAPPSPEPAYLSAVADTPWRVAVWPNPPALGLPDAKTAYALLVAGVLLLIAGPLAMRGRIRRAVGKDTGTLARMIADVRAAHLAGEYDIELGEFETLATRMLAAGKQLIEEQNALLQTSQSDPLTGVASEAAFNVRVAQLHGQARLGFPSSVVLLGLDGIDDINNRYGHAGGDAVLRHMAESLKTSLRQSDYIGRLTGTTFALILPFIDSNAAAAGIAQLRSKIRAEVEIEGSRKIQYTWSAGVSTMTATDDAAADVVRRCHAALEQARSGGGDQTVVEEPAPAD